MTEEDCRELWRIIQGLEREYKEMNSIADDWFPSMEKDGMHGGAGGHDPSPPGSGIRTVSSVIVSWCTGELVGWHLVSGV